MPISTRVTGHSTKRAQHNAPKSRASRRSSQHGGVGGVGTTHTSREIQELKSMFNDAAQSPIPKIADADRGSEMEGIVITFDDLSPDTEYKKSVRAATSTKTDLSDVTKIELYQEKKKLIIHQGHNHTIYDLIDSKMLDKMREEVAKEGTPSYEGDIVSYIVDGNRVTVETYPLPKLIDEKSADKCNSIIATHYIQIDGGVNVVQNRSHTGCALQINEPNWENKLEWTEVDDGVSVHVKSGTFVRQGNLVTVLVKTKTTEENASTEESTLTEEITMLSEPIEQAEKRQRKMMDSFQMDEVAKSTVWRRLKNTVLRMFNNMKSGGGVWKGNGGSTNSGNSDNAAIDVSMAAAVALILVTNALLFVPPDILFSKPPYRDAVILALRDGMKNVKANIYEIGDNEKTGIAIKSTPRSPPLANIPGWEGDKGLAKITTYIDTWRGQSEMMQMFFDMGQKIYDTANNAGVSN
jgi:hypothetical protein